MSYQRLVLWVDDDSETDLRHLGRSLERRQLEVERFVSLSSAKKRLRRLTAVSGAAKISLLVDIILPRTSSGNALKAYLGLELASFAADLGVDRICFLTVIRRGEIEEEVKSLKKSFPGAEFIYEDKLDLLNPGKLRSIAKFLGDGQEA